MTLQNTNGGAASVDLDILAVKALMEQERPQKAKSANMRIRASQTAPIQGAAQTTENAPDTSEATSKPTPVRKKRALRVRHILAVAVLASVVMRPSLLVWLLVLLISPVVLLFIFLCCVGVDGFWHRTRSFYLRIKARNPALAKRIRKGFYAGAARWDAILDRLPGTMPEAAYVPDFQAAHAADLAHQRALEKRFNRLRDELDA